jgi:hypothetical protein
MLFSHLCLCLQVILAMEIFQTKFCVYFLFPYVCVPHVLPVSFFLMYSLLSVLGEEYTLQNSALYNISRPYVTISLTLLGPNILSISNTP